jgi:hypothetical protein
MKIKNTEANGRIVFEVVNARRQGGILHLQKMRTGFMYVGGRRLRTEFGR